MKEKMKERKKNEKKRLVMNVEERKKKGNRNGQ